MWNEVKSDTVALLKHVAAFLRDYRWWIVAYLVGGGLLTWGVSRWDQPVREYYVPFQKTEERRVAIAIRRLGDSRDAVFYVTALYALGAWRKRREWRVFAVATLLGAILAGLTVNVIRISTGRPRPHTGLTEWIGPTLFQYRMQSFPSGHTGTSLGMSTTLIQLFPILGVPAFAGSVAVGWASIAAHKHYPSDIAGAAVIGCLSGVACAAAARRRVRELQPPGDAA
ncbi:MAG: phosphatase PAP2 family protein [Kiritimatiellae bacterium]|nr:phosphatase PAP2 family protein [Kiritimatiellia bacterium]MDW8458890.1 phosphatase PAP2 family protein [Verrucomicrobiota bacterium]